MASMPGVASIGRVYYAETTERINEDVLERLTAYYDDEDGGQSYWVESNENASRQYSGLKRTGETTVSVYGMDVSAAQTGNYYLGGFDKDRFESGGYAIALGLAGNGEGSVHYEVGDKITIKGKTYELMGMMEPPDSVSGNFHSAQNELEIDYVINTTSFRESFPGIPAMSAFIDTGDPRNTADTVLALRQEYPAMQVATRLTYGARFQSQVLAQVIMGYTLGLIMALIGILNFVNSMLTAIISRKREFAILESVGMTKRQLKQMLVYEGVSYAAISLAASIILASLVASTAIQEVVSGSWAASYSFSLLPFGIIAPVMVLLAIMIPLACFKGTHKKTLVERLRETEA
jgi:putative ABC transport system permease protein